MKNICMKKLLVSVAAVGVSTIAFGEITTGWLEATGGTKYFNDPANWANGEVNGVFSSDLVVSTADNTISLTNGWTGTLRIFSSIGAKMNFNSAWIKSTAEGPFVLTLDDDLYLQPSTMGADVTFGNSYNAGNALNFDLGGTSRKIYMNGGSRWIFSNRMLNGDVEFVGTGTFTLRSAAGFDGDVTLPPGMKLSTGYTSSDKTDLDVVRAQNMTLNRAEVTFAEGQVNVTDTVQGVLRVLDDEQKCSILTARCTTSGKSEVVHIGSLELDPGALLLVRGAKLGNQPGPDAANVYFEEPPEMIGGIVPQLFGAKADEGKSTGGLSGMYDGSLMTYDSSVGLRPLDLSTEYATTIPEGGDPVNLLVPPTTTITIASDTTVNSVYLQTTADDATFSTVSAENGARLTVKSGMIVFGYPRNSSNYVYPLVEVPLEFGMRRGVFVSLAGGKRVQINSAIAGTGGLLFTMPAAIGDAALSGLNVGGDAGASTYTGDTYIQCSLAFGTTDFLPHGSRTGDVYVNGTLSGDDFTINGLYGKGLVQRASSGGKGLTLGDNDADGDFEGDVTITDAGAVLTKIGTGTQRFAGTLTLKSEIRVTAGSVVIDGTVAQGAVTVADGAAIGGKGVINTSLAFTGNATLAASKGEGKSLAPLTVNGAVTAGGTITVSAASEDWKGESCVLTSTEPLTGITFAKGANVAGLELRNDDKELWARNVKGLIIMFK